jgi:hypothetical protein
MFSILVPYWMLAGASGSLEANVLEADVLGGVVLKGPGLLGRSG